jgi:NAD(P)-dependent dehydrogenase (short-subunit alcohol dehydrogenase family)
MHPSPFFPTVLDRSFHYKAGARRRREHAMDLHLTGKTAVVTGASKGIGLAVTRRLLEEGANVVAASRGSSPELEALAGGGAEAAEVPGAGATGARGANGPRLVHVRADLADPDAPAEVVARAVEAFGGLDVLVNNVGGRAGEGPHTSFLHASDADWQAVFELNLFSAIRAARAALPLLVERRGSIVNISSVNARVPNTAVPEYSAAKAAMSNLTQTLSEEFAPQGVRVNTISPGPVNTPLWTAEGGMAHFIAAQAGTDAETAVATVIPQAMQLTTGRFIEAEEVASLVALLTSPVSASTTGADFVVDAGYLKAV